MLNDHFFVSRFLIQGILFSWIFYPFLLALISVTVTDLKCILQNLISVCTHVTKPQSGYTALSSFQCIPLSPRGNGSSDFLLHRMILFVLNIAVLCYTMSE